MAIYPSASGYAGMEASPLAQVHYSDTFLSRVYERDWLYRITNGQIMEPIVHCGQVIQLLHAPEVGPMKPYSKNMPLTPDTVSLTARYLTICAMGYTDIKFDITDIKQACDRWAPFEEKLLESMYQRYIETMRTFVLGRMMAQVSPETSFNGAGVYQDVNLGEPGNPVVVTPENLPVVLGNLQRVLIEQGRWVDGEMFILIPPALRTYIAMSNYSNSLWSCSCGTIVDGMWDKQLFGFTPIETRHVPTQIDPSGQLGFYIIAGHKDATAYASNILEARLTDDANYMGVRYQYVAAWGAEVIYPDAIAVGYWTLNPLIP